MRQLLCLYHLKIDAVGREQLCALRVMHNFLHENLWYMHFETTPFLLNQISTVNFGHKNVEKGG